jgi:hypothetical protein
VRSGAVLKTSRAARGALALAIGALIALPGCGSGGSSGDPIPQNDANRLLALLQLAGQQAADGKCGGADAKAREALTVAAALPRGVDKDVRQGLVDGLRRLRVLIGTQCRRQQVTPTQTETTATETTPTETTPTETTRTETTPTETTQTQTTQTETTQTNTGTGTGTTTTPTTTTGNGGVPGAGAGAGGNGQ